MNCVISIDPSINNCGIAVWLKDNESKWKLGQYGLIEPDKSTGDDEYLKAKNVCEQVVVVVDYAKTKYDVQVVLEVPAHWTIGGFYAREGGKLQKLIFLCGGIYCIIPNVFWVYPGTWKGQYTKPVTRNRLMDIHFKNNDRLRQIISKVNFDTMDAIGIGFWYIFKRIIGKTV